LRIDAASSVATELPDQPAANIRIGASEANWNPQRPMRKAANDTYIPIMNGGKTITCLDCGLTSWSENDVRERYCPVCREFHDDKEMKARPPELCAQSPAPADFFADWS
jgi:hypothetical protein